MDDESFFVLEEVENKMPNNANKEVSLTTAKNSKNSLDVTFAVGARTGVSGSSKESQQGRSSSASRGSKISRARWSLPSETSLNDGVSLSERYAKHQEDKGKSTEEL